jgi:NhaA family Na+:H+ antiporter
MSILPDTPAARLGHFVRRFLHIESATGFVLLGCAAVALALANSPWGEAVRSFWETPIVLSIGAFELDYPLWYWVNDGLMALFFFVIGLEIKREMTTGELSDRRAVLLPAFAAVGGAIVPALIFLAINGTGAGAAAWAVPTATDIAFVVGLLALLGSRVPPALKIFMLSLAIFDDLLAVVIIAVFFSDSIGAGWLAGAGATLAAIYVMQRSGVRRVGPYALVGTATWLFTLKSGVHPTVAGVVLGLMTPARPLLSAKRLGNTILEAGQRLRTQSRARLTDLGDAVRFAARESVSPAERVERALHPWVAFGIMPVFALANAGVRIEPALVGSALAIAVALGLLVGKLLGVTGGVWLAVKLGWANLPTGVNWRVMAAASCLAGIGFTMSMFIASLALSGTGLEAVKTGVLLGSFVAGVVGLVGLRLVLDRPAHAPESEAPAAARQQTPTPARLADALR